jgi:hypothetical protein
VQEYKPNSEDFSDLDEEDGQEQRINTTSPTEFENKVNNNSTLVVEKEILGNSLV